MSALRNDDTAKAQETRLERLRFYESLAVLENHPMLESIQNAIRFTTKWDWEESQPIEEVRALRIVRFLLGIGGGAKKDGKTFAVRFRTRLPRTDSG